MWNPNLNRHFAKFLSAIKIPAFLVLWNGVFHSLTLSILVYWSITSNRVMEMNRMTTLNQFWSENEILFATLSTVSVALFFLDRTTRLVREARLNLFLINFLRGALFAVLLVGGLVLTHRYDFLGFSAQLNLNFLQSYAWILRAVLVFFWVVSTEFLVRIVVQRETSSLLSKFRRKVIEVACYLSLYWIWFSPTLQETFTLVLFFFLFRSFWSSTAFLSAFFILTHAIFGLPFFQNEFVGLVQVKSTRSDEHFLQNPFLIVTLILLWIAFRGFGKFMVRWKATAKAESKPGRKLTS